MTIHHFTAQTLRKIHLPELNSHSMQCLPQWPENLTICVRFPSSTSHNFHLLYQSAWYKYHSNPNDILPGKRDHCLSGYSVVTTNCWPFPRHERCLGQYCHKQADCSLKCQRCLQMTHECTGQTLTPGDHQFFNRWNTRFQYKYTSILCSKTLIFQTFMLFMGCFLGNKSLQFLTSLQCLLRLIKHLNITLTAHISAHSSRIHHRKYCPFHQ